MTFPEQTTDVLDKNEENQTEVIKQKLETSEEVIVVPSVTDSEEAERPLWWLDISDEDTQN